MRSECSARLVQTFWPLMMYVSSLRTAVVLRLKVSVPLEGSLTPKAWRRSRPAAISGSQRCFWTSLPWRSTVPMT
jgi:hypothetical protein